MVGGPVDDKPPSTRARRHLARDAGLVTVALAAGFGLTFLPRLWDGDGGSPSGSGPLPAGEAESVVAGSSSDGSAPALTVAGADSAVAAVDGFLGAEQRGDLAGSFDLLSADDRRAIPSIEDWLAVHAEVLPPVVGYEVGEPEADGPALVVPSVVEFEPRLDEFSGLVPGRSTVSWRVVEDDLGWRVSLADSSIEPVYPPDGEATVAAQDWLDTGGPCDPQAAAGSGVTFLGLRPYLSERLCGTSDPLVAGAVAAIDDPLLETDLVTAFGPDASDWARVVPVALGPDSVELVLAPVGDRWAVIDVTEAGR